MSIKLRCFFGLSHGKWIEVSDPATLMAVPGPYGSTYRCVPIQIAYARANGVPGKVAERYILLAENHDMPEVIDWLFTYQPDHPKHLDADNHPRTLAARSRIKTHHAGD